MANASAKKTAASNERAISNLRQGLLIATTLSTLIRIIFRTKSLSPAQLSFWIHILSHIPSTLIARYLARIGEPKRSDTGELVSPGEDLSQPGIIEWCFDVIYVACKSGLDSSITISQTTSCRDVSNRKRDIWREVLVVSYSRKSYLHFTLLVLNHSRYIVDPTICVLQNLVIIPWAIPWLWKDF